MGSDCSTRTDGQTDMTKLIVDFRNFANAPKNDVCTYAVKNVVITSINSIRGSRYARLKPMAFCEQIKFIIHYRTFYFYANKYYRNK